MNKIWIVLLSTPFIIAALIVNFLFSTDNISLAQKAENTAMAGNYARAENVYDKMLVTDPLNVKLNRDKIRSHFNIPEKTGKNSYRDDKPITNKYKGLANSSNQQEADIGLYGLGYIEIMQGNSDKAIEYYLQVKNSALPYLNNSIGYVYLSKKNYSEAESYFLKEIEAETNISGAYSNLAQVYEANKDDSKLKELLADTETNQYVSERLIRHHLYEKGDYKEYSTYAFKLGNYTTTGLVGAVLILIVWVVFLLWIDVYETEKVRHILFALALGCGFSMLATPLYDFYFVSLGWELNGNYLNDLLYCIFAIGVIEEVVKIIPFLILLRFKSIINESMDYIVYASVCALGFAFMENIMYFHESGLDDLLSRSLSATILHMTLTSFVAYGLMYAKYKGTGGSARYFTFAFFAACLVHGLYDFWILSDGWVGQFRILSLLILFYAVQRYALAIANALNHSEFSLGKGQLVRSAEYLGLALTVVAAYQYTVIGYKFGAENANVNFFTMLLSSAFLAYILVTVLGNIKVTNGEWVSILKVK